MAVRPSFVAHVLDLLEGFEAVEAKRMFGGMGLWSEGRMFALFAEDGLYLKTDAENVRAFDDAKCEAFSFKRGRRKMVTHYRRVPDSALEDPEALRPWARLAMAAASRKAESSPKRTSGDRTAKRRGRS